MIKTIVIALGLAFVLVAGMAGMLAWKSKRTNYKGPIND